ncbi:phosphotransferase [Roseibacillus ishigakijimensis]|uniref:Phosphotransferase n=1 Tax=Roseibacillus ishigakijimensis TaxID=454146 RepID=A0A934VLZ5_9BACT|nr:phosphotransferase [Roseibacillus ishigakijimensis]MBK1833732.1 phosphotransferase [Roseibacillus ishigakijimensis]
MAADLLLTAIRQHLDLYPTHKVILEPIASGASGRTLARLKPEGHPTFIGLHYTDERPDNVFFLPLAAFLKSARLNVPIVLYDNQPKGLAIVEDLGEKDLLSLKDEPYEVREPYYRSVFTQLDKLAYTKVPKDLEMMPPFTTETYQWEQNYFCDHFVEKHLGRDASALRTSEALEKLATRLGRSHRHLVHRDLQSQNIVLHDDKAYLIDFQGMRWGHQEYDLASLLYDPYMNHSAEDRERMLDLWEDITEERPIPQLLRECAIQRLMQALGAYGNIVENYHNEWYRQHIPTAQAFLRENVADTEFEELLAPFL